MSAIVGFFNRDGRPAEPELLSKMLNAINYYGPDGRAAWVEGPVALGSLQMQTTPQSRHEAQPVHLQDKVLVADARIDNREELYNKLPIAHSQRAKLADSHLIAHADAKWGREAAHRLIGAFAYAAWNRTTQQLTIAVDHLSIRPLYYHLTTRLFAFATHPTALWAHPEIGYAPNEREIAAYLQSIFYIPTGETLYRGILKFKWAHTLTIDAQSHRSQRYWYPFELPARNLPSEDAYAEALRELLEEAVACRLNLMVPAAVDTSGGLDSTGVAALGARVLKKQGKQFVAGYSWAPPISEEWPRQERDDRDAINHLNDHEQIPIQYVCATPEDIVEYATRTPLMGAGFNYFPERRVARLAAAQGVRVILSGWGGDEAITKNLGGYLEGLFWRGHWRLGWQVAMALRSSGLASKRSIVRDLFDSALPSPWAERGMMKSFQPPSLIDAAFAEKINPHVRKLIAFRRHVGLRKTQQSYLEQQSLPKTPANWDGWCAPHGMTHAYPLLDRRVMEFAYTMPESLFVQRGIGRYLYRRALQDLLPQPLCWYPKQLYSAREDQLEPISRPALKLLLQLGDKQGWLSNHSRWLNQTRLRDLLKELTVGDQPKIDSIVFSRLLRSIDIAQFELIF